MASTVTSVKILLDANKASSEVFNPMYAMDTAPNVRTVGYQIVLSIHCRNIARNPNRLPYASPTQRKTPPSFCANMAASSAATRAVGTRNTMAANK